MAHAVGVINGNFRAGMYREYRQQVEADARDPKQALLRIERKLMQECKDLEGDSFVVWYESDAVPDNGFIQERIDMIRARIADLQVQPSPIDEAQAMGVALPNGNALASKTETELIEIGKDYRARLDKIKQDLAGRHAAPDLQAEYDEIDAS